MAASPWLLGDEAPNGGRGPGAGGPANTGPAGGPAIWANTFALYARVEMTTAANANFLMISFVEMILVLTESKVGKAYKAEMSRKLIFPYPDDVPQAGRSVKRPEVMLVAL